MRCEQVIQELAAPSHDRDAAALARHLAGCPACAARERAFARLDRAWEATRPREPGADAWNAVWTNIAEALPAARAAAAAAETAVPFAPAAPRRNTARTALVNLARAAGVLLAVGLAWWTIAQAPHGPEQGPVVAQQNLPAPASPQGPVPVRLNAPVLVETDIEEAHIILIRADGPAPQVVDMAPAEAAYGVDDMYVMFNLIESIANPVVAAR